MAPVTHANISIHANISASEGIDMNAWSTEGATAGLAAKEEVNRLLRGLDTRQRYSAGSAIFAEGDHANAVYRVESGAVALWRRLPNGKYFGVVHRPSQAISAEASSDCEVSAFRRGEVDGTCDAVPSFYRSISSLLAEPVRSRGELLCDEMRTAKERIAEFLLLASRRVSQAAEAGLPLSGHNIGECVDEPDELVSHCLEDLAAIGAVTRTGDGRLVVMDRALLQSVA
jgi:CRP-like cAMP-binding protein